MVCRGLGGMWIYGRLGAAEWVFVGHGVDEVVDSYGRTRIVIVFRCICLKFVESTFVKWWRMCFARCFCLEKLEV